MQKKIIAAAIIGMVSAAASAATVYDKDGTKVSVGGKFDFAVITKDAAGKQTLQVSDGVYSTSRFTLGAEEAINSDLVAYAGFDLRFDNIYTGKNDTASVTITTKAATCAAVPCTIAAQTLSTSGGNGGGISSNDAMKGGLKSKKFGKIEAGTINVASQQFVYKKNYVNKSESEIVKYGVSSIGLESLSNRTVYVQTPDTLPVALKASYSYNDALANDTGLTKKVGMWSYGLECKFGIFGCGAALTVKPNTSYTAVSNQLKHYEGYAFLEQNGKKLSFFASHDSDLGTQSGKVSSGSGFGLNAYYLIGDKWDLGIAGQRYVDQSEGVVKNSGKGYMAGVHYYASKGVAFFAGTRFDNWEGKANTDKVGKIQGTNSTWMTTATKADSRSYFGGMNFSF